MAIYTRRSYGTAMDEGYTILETIYDSLNERTATLLDELMGVITDLLDAQAKPKRKIKAKTKSKTAKTAKTAKKERVA